MKKNIYRFKLFLVWMFGLESIVERQSRLVAYQRDYLQAMFDEKQEAEQYAIEHAKHEFNCLIEKV